MQQRIFQILQLFVLIWIEKDEDIKKLFKNYPINLLSMILQNAS